MSWMNKQPALAGLAGVAVGALATLVFDPVMAQMCKWVDEDGSIHYAEQCPDGVEGQHVEIHQGPSEEAVKQD